MSIVLIFKPGYVMQKPASEFNPIDETARDMGAYVHEMGRLKPLLDDTFKGFNRHRKRSTGAYQFGIRAIETYQAESSPTKKEKSLLTSLKTDLANLAQNPKKLVNYVKLLASTKALVEYYKSNELSTESSKTLVYSIHTVVSVIDKTLSDPNDVKIKAARFRYGDKVAEMQKDVKGLLKEINTIGKALEKKLSPQATPQGYIDQQLLETLERDGIDILRPELEREASQLTQLTTVAKLERLAEHLKNSNAMSLQDFIRQHQADYLLLMENASDSEKEAFVELSQQVSDQSILQKVKDSLLNAAEEVTTSLLAAPAIYVYKKVTPTMVQDTVTALTPVTLQSRAKEELGKLLSSTVGNLKNKQKDFPEQLKSASLEELEQAKKTNDLYMKTFDSYKELIDELPKKPTPVRKSWGDWFSSLFKSLFSGPSEKEKKALAGQAIAQAERIKAKTYHFECDMVALAKNVNVSQAVRANLAEHSIAKVLSTDLTKEQRARFSLFKGKSQEVIAGSEQKEASARGLSF